MLPIVVLLDTQTQLRHTGDAVPVVAELLIDAHVNFPVYGDPFHLLQPEAIGDLSEDKTTVYSLNRIMIGKNTKNIAVWFNPPEKSNTAWVVSWWSLLFSFVDG